MGLFKRSLGVGLAVLMAATQVSCALAQSADSEASSSSGTFDPNHVLDDRDIFDIGGMNLAQIKQFLDSRGTLGKIKIKDIDGVEKPVADIVWRIAGSYKLNPKYLLALMQKEQSLVEDPNPTQKQFDWATGFAVCDSCSMDDPVIQNFKGFASQLEWAAKQHREKYLLQILGRGTTVSGIAPGKAVTIDKQILYPANQATAMLYTYTPHLNGNMNLWRIWQRWFGLALTDGMVVKGRSSGKTYLIRFGTKRPFKSIAALYSMVDQSKVVTIEDSQIANYPNGKPIAFANYSLVELPDGKRYLLVNDKKRLIKNAAVFSKLGFNEDEINEVKAADITDYADGSDITLASAYPTGLLARDANKQYWYVEDGARHRLPDKAFLNLYFKNQTSKLLTQKALQNLKLSDPYKLRDGELVRLKNDPAVYVIENGQRRLIPSAAAFQEMGWNWKNVVVLSQAVLKDYALGNPVDPHAGQNTQLATDF